MAKRRDESQERPGTPENYELLIKEAHIDTFGHVNNAVYLALFEEARWDMITRNGFGLKEIQSRAMGPVVLEAKLRFHHEVKNRDRVTIRTQSGDYRGRIGRLYQTMFLSDGAPACSAEFVIGFMDLKSRQLIRPPAEWLTAVGYPDKAVQTSSGK